LSAFLSAEDRPIKIFIADDSVSDVNAEVIADLISLHKSIVVHCNVENLGIDANIQHAVDMCDCNYAWLIGEDDEFLPGAIARMYDFLKDRKAPFIFSAYQYVCEDHLDVLGVVRIGNSDAEIGVENFISNQLWAIGFIGSVVVNREMWGYTDARPYLGTYFTHVGRILEMLSTEKVTLVCSEPAVSNRAQGDDTFTWKKDSFGVFLGFERMCKIAADRNQALTTSLGEALVNYRKKFAYFSIKTTFRLRSEGAFDLRQFRSHIWGVDSIESWRKLWMLCLAVTPVVLIKPLALLYIHSLRYINKYVLNSKVEN
jgi:glycosyltransferase involved in cell wall biosynthesis